MIDSSDMDHCRQMIRTGSLSFHTASLLLPQKVRDPALALYAFCRLADDAVDEGDDKTGAVLSLRDRLELVYSGRPRNTPADRAFAAVVSEFEMPRVLPEALLEGLAWDAMERRYDTLSEVLGYSARVAAAVGAMMCVLMRARDADTLARACDLGLAMQLTNIARDVGEDARAGRLYLPQGWFAEVGMEPAAFLSNPDASPEIRRMTQKLLVEATRLYARSASGVARLPVGCRPGIHAARRIYAGIGSEVARHKFDSISRRAHTSRGQKLRLLGHALVDSGLSILAPTHSRLHAPPEPEVAFLVEAASHRHPPRRSEQVLQVLAQLEARDRARRGQSSALA